MQKQPILIFILFLLASCASPGLPSGGPIDSEPPEVTKTVPENKKTGLKPYIIEVNFNEYIVLKDLQNQLIISPIIEPKPEIKVKNKTLTIDMSKCKLNDNTTYVMNFGNAIVDFTEGNPIRGYTYVFSTGSYIDSLSISGTAIDAFNLEKKEGVSIQLYKDLSDTAIYKSKPDYVTKTNSSGAFTLSYLAPGNYRIYAIDDVNKNYQLNKDEKVGYLSDIIEVESSIDNIELRYYLPELKTSVIEAKQISKGVFKFTFNKDIKGHLKSIKANGTNTNKRTITHIKHFDSGDSLYFYSGNLNFADMDSVDFNISTGDTTIKIKMGINNELEYSQLRVSIKEDRVAPNDSIVFESYSPIKYISEGKVRLMDLTDTTEVGTFEVNQVFEDQFTFYVKSNWKEGHQYKVIFLDSMIVDVNGIYKGASNDTLLNTKFRVKKEEETGTLNLQLVLPKLDSLVVEDSSDKYMVSLTSYIIQLVDNSDNVQLEFQLDNLQKTEHNISLKYLTPKEYRIKIIREDNQVNQVWDKGTLKTYTQPEMVYYYPKKLNVRANWELDGIIINLPSK